MFLSDRSFIMTFFSASLNFLKQKVLTFQKRKEKLKDMTKTDIYQAEKFI